MYHVTSPSIHTAQPHITYTFPTQARQREQVRKVSVATNDLRRFRQTDPGSIKKNLFLINQQLWLQAEDVFFLSFSQVFLELFFVCVVNDTATQPCKAAGA